MSVKEVQPLNALSPMLDTPSGRTRLCKELQNKNASFPMLVTLSEMIISNRELQPLTADSAYMANQLILLRTKQKDAEVIMQTLRPNRIHIPNCYWEYLQKWYGKI